MSVMNLEFQLKGSWPKLAWVAVLEPEDERLVVHHGPMVEIRRDWAVEGVWDGDFKNGDFDKTDLFFGSGIRVRGGGVTFVSSSTGCDRLWYIEINSCFYVSNSLPALLGSAGLTLISDYKKYTDDIATIRSKGLYTYHKNIPVNGGKVNIIYYNNIEYKGGVLFVSEKITKKYDFSNYKKYKEFLCSTAKKIGANATSNDRANPINMLVGLSSGYDSVAAAVVAKSAGCNKAASITNSSSFWRGSDSGEEIAKYLSLNCDLYKHKSKNYKNEAAVWAGSGSPGGRNLSLFNYAEPLTLFFSGGYGDTVWDRAKQDLKEPVGAFEELICEFRLIQGVILTQVPWWGIRQAADIQKISLLDEMKPWTLGNDYDRPIPRRLGEEDGVPRKIFGITKKNTASNSPFWWPAQPELRKDFNSYLGSVGVKSYSSLRVHILSNYYLFLKILNSSFVSKFTKKSIYRPWLKEKSRSHLFQWANFYILNKFYRQGVNNEK